MPRLRNALDYAGVLGREESLGDDDVEKYGEHEGPRRDAKSESLAAQDPFQASGIGIRQALPGPLGNPVKAALPRLRMLAQQARAAYEAAVQSRILQEKSVAVEQQKFDVGVSTNFLVIQYQSYLAQARSTEVAAKGAYAKARIALERATGRILESNHVSIDEAYQGRVSRPPAQIP